MGWVGLGQLFGGLGWAGSMKIDPRTTLVYPRIFLSVLFVSSLSMDILLF